MTKHPKRKILAFGPMTLVAWLSNGRTQIKLLSVSDKHFDQMRLSAYAASYFSDHLSDTPQGMLLDLAVLRDLLRMIGLDDLAAHLPDMEPDSPKPLPRVISKLTTKEIRPDQIKKLFELMSQGHSQAYASRMSGIGEATVSRLRRGLVKGNLAPGCEQAWKETFGRTTEHQGKRVKGASQDVDERNASLIPQLYQLIHIKGLSFAKAAQTLGISTSKANRLCNRTYKSWGPKTQAAWASSFNRAPDHTQK